MRGKIIFAALLIWRIIFAPVSAKVERITGDTLVVKNGTFQPETVHLSCWGEHTFCTWKPPGGGDMCTMQQNCKQDGIVLNDNIGECSVAVKITSTTAQAGQWTCFLYRLEDEIVLKEQASTRLFVIDLEEVPMVKSASNRRIQLAHENSIARSEFECSGKTLAPVNHYRWRVGDRIVQEGGGRKLQLNLTRSDFNKTVKCTIIKALGVDAPPVHEASSSLRLTALFMDPVIKSVSASLTRVILEVESWPLINFIRISPIDNCEKDCVIINCDVSNSFKCSVNKSPYLKTASVVEDVLVRHGSADARVEVEVILMDASTPSSFQPDELFINVGNNLSIATTKVDMAAIRENPNAGLLALAAPGPASKRNVLVTAVVLSILAVVVIVLTILLIVFRKPISEYFKCGEYLVNNQSDLEDGEETDKEAIGKDDVMHAPEDVKIVLLQKTDTVEDPVETSL